MGSATRERRLAAMAALLGVGAAMCNREKEPTTWPVQAREVPSAAPDPIASSVAPIDASVQGEPPDASAAIADAATAQPPPSAPPPPVKPTPLSAFERFAPPPLRLEAPPAPPRPTRSGIEDSCGAPSAVPGPPPPQFGPVLGVVAVIGLKVRPGLDPEVAARATSYLSLARLNVAQCGHVMMRFGVKSGALNIEVYAAEGGAGVAFSVVSTTVPPDVGACVLDRLGSLRGALVGPPPKLVFPILLGAQWVDLGSGSPGKP